MVLHRPVEAVAARVDLQVRQRLTRQTPQHQQTLRQQTANLQATYPRTLQAPLILHHHTRQVVAVHLVLHCWGLEHLRAAQAQAQVRSLDISKGGAAKFGAK